MLEKINCQQHFNVTPHHLSSSQSFTNDHKFNSNSNNNNNNNNDNDRPLSMTPSSATMLSPQQDEDNTYNDSSPPTAPNYNSFFQPLPPINSVSNKFFDIDPSTGMSPLQLYAGCKYDKLGHFNGGGNAQEILPSYPGSCDSNVSTSTTNPTETSSSGNYDYAANHYHHHYSNTQQYLYGHLASSAGYGLDSTGQPLTPEGVLKSETKQFVPNHNFYYPQASPHFVAYDSYSKSFLNAAAGFSYQPPQPGFIGSPTAPMALNGSMFHAVPQLSNRRDMISSHPPHHLPLSPSYPQHFFAKSSPSSSSFSFQDRMHTSAFPPGDLRFPRAIGLPHSHALNQHGGHHIHHHSHHEMEEINTRELAQKISSELKRYSIPQAVFAQRVLCRSQGTLSDLLRNPKPWSKLKSGRETFRRMWKWLQEPEFQRMSALRLAGWFLSS